MTTLRRTSRFNLKRLATILMVAFVLPALFLVTGCSPTTEGESKTWTRKNETAKEYATTWPGFKTVIDAQVTAAGAVWKEAEGISDKEAKAAKMKEANELLGKLVGRLGEVKYKSEGIEKTIDKMNKLKLNKTKDKTRSNKTDDAHKVLNKVNETMKAAAPADLDAAVAILKEQISDLISGQGAADRGYKALGGGKRKSKKSKKKKRSKK